MEDMNNLDIYNQCREVPQNACKTIQDGKLKGKTDINPMWRIKMLTEIFGICGIGWKTTIERTWLDIGANGEQTAHVQISLYVKSPDTNEWSDAIAGIGGVDVSEIFILHEVNIRGMSKQIIAFNIKNSVNKAFIQSLINGVYIKILLFIFI